MYSLLAACLALMLAWLSTGCTEYSGSKLNRSAAVGRSEYVVVGKILAEERSRIPGNDFFTRVECKVKVLQIIKGSTEKVITVAYMLEGDKPENPFRVGDVCVFNIFVKSLAEPGLYLVGKMMPGTPENVALVRSEAGC